MDKLEIDGYGNGRDYGNSDGDGDGTGYVDGNAEWYDWFTDEGRGCGHTYGDRHGNGIGDGDTGNGDGDGEGDIEYYNPSDW